MQLANKGLLKRAAQIAIQKQLANGVPAIWMTDGVVFKLHPDGRKETLATPQRRSAKLTQHRFYIRK
jgi:hypothetical protein